MRQKLTFRPVEAVHRRIESITPRGGSIAHTAEYVINAAFNLAEGSISLDEFLTAVKMGPAEKRAPKTPKPKPPKPESEEPPKPQRARKPSRVTKPVDPSVNPWD